MRPPASPLSQALRSTALAVLLACAVLLPLLGHNRLTDWDEGIYAQIAREFLWCTHACGWLVPHWNTQPWLEKPPLMLWITAVFFKLFGVSEFWARAASAFSGIVLVGLLHGWLTLRRNALTAWLNSFFLLTTFGFLHVARVGEMDVLLSLGLCAALIGLAEVQDGDRIGWYLFWLGFAVALMTKGAASVTLVLTVFVFAALEPVLLRRIGKEFAIGLAFFLAVVLPWHVLVYRQFGQLFLDQYLGLHVLARASMQMEGHISPWWFYLRVLLVSAAPFVLLCPVTLYQGLRRPGLVRVFAVFAVVELVFFSLVQTRLPHYIAPAYPALTVLSAVYVADWLTAHPRALYLRYATGAVVLYLVSAWITAGPRGSLHSPRLPNGNVTPDNREQVALLRQVLQHPTPAITAVPGPLLVWRPGTYVPLPTTLFYAGRAVQQVQLAPVTPDATINIYWYNPIPLNQAVSAQPRLVLLDRSLIPQVPAGYTYRPIATSATLEIGTLSR